MVRRVVTGVVGAAAIGLLVAGCGTAPEGPEESPTSLWPPGSASELAGTGMTLLGGSGQGEVVVDGAGMAWVDGPWQVARVDPTSGESAVWDAADDAAFASVTDLAPGIPRGVWLVEPDRATLFDGDRLVMRLGIPTEYRDGPDGEGPTRDLLQVGAEVWVSGTGGVARWSSGAWTPVAPEQLVEAGPLAVDSDGSVWAGGLLATEQGRTRHAAVRYDGQSWVEPDAQDAPAGGIVDIAAAPGGGVWVASAREGTADHGVFRFDGTGWTRVGPGGYVGDLSVTDGGDLWAMASAGGGESGSGSTEVSRLAADGTWQPFGAEEGAPVGGEVQWPRLAVAGERVLVTGDVGLVASQGDRFATLWQDPSRVLDVLPDVPPDVLVPVDADEVWMMADAPPKDPGVAPDIGLAGLRDGRWARIGPSAAGDHTGAPVLASDAAVWAVTGEGLVRAVGDAWSLVDDQLDVVVAPALAAGEDGSVWTIDGGSVVRIDPDGTRTSIGRPGGGARLWPTGPLAARGGIVWVVALEGELLRWDGSWQAVPRPSPATRISQMVAMPDGALWAVASDDELSVSGVARLADGRWAWAQGDVLGLAAAPDGAVCTMRRAELDVACFDDGLALVRSLAVGAFPSALGIAVDGSVWVLGEQVARLARSEG